MLLRPLGSGVGEEDDAADLGSGTAVDGQVLTADGAGGTDWEAIPSGITDHTLLTNIGINTHVTIDSHLAGTTAVHGVAGSVVGTTDIQTLTHKTLTSPDVNGGTIDGTPIGNSTPSTGSFTDLTATGTLSGVEAEGNAVAMAIALG